MKSQRMRILNFLKAGYTLTPMKALKLFQCFRLGARIWELKKEGHLIGRTFVDFGFKKVASYRILK